MSVKLIISSKLKCQKMSVLKVFVKKVLKKIFGPRGEEETESWKLDYDADMCSEMHIQI